MEIEIKRVDIASITKICFVLYSILGLIIGVIYVFMALVLGSALDYAAAPDDLGLLRVAATGVGLLLVPLLALFYGCIGAIAGMLFGIFYNLVARAIGGVKLSVSGNEVLPASTSIE
jgi:hypothetical protein